MNPTNTTKILAIGVAVATAWILGAWSYIFNVHPSGKLEGPVVFEFYNGTDTHLITAVITNFGVSERTSEGRWRPIWSLAGKARIGSIRYGAKYEGLKETTPAGKLIAGKVYMTFADDGAGGSAGRYFRFKSDGTMEFPDSPD